MVSWDWSGWFDTLTVPAGAHPFPVPTDFSQTLFASAEVYSPRTGAWTAINRMHDARYLHTATLLPNGQVLVTGGLNCYHPGIACTPLASAELLDLATGTWSYTGSMTTARWNHTATLLPDGKVLVTGGCSTSNCSKTLASAELYDPGTGVWSPAGSMATTRAAHTATLLADGRVLVAGGQDCMYIVPFGYQCPTLAGAELYSPGAGPFVQLSPGSLAFGNQAVTTSSSPQTVTVTNTGTRPLTITDVTFDGANPEDYTQTNTCTLATIAPGRSCTVAVRFAPVAVGNRDASLTIADNAPTNPQEVGLTGYATGPDGWVATGSMTAARVSDTAILLHDGRVLVAGGESSCDRVQCCLLSSAELYDPRTGTWTATGSMTTARYYHTATLLADGRVLVVGGCGTLGCSQILSSAELYDPQTGTWTPTGAMAARRVYHTATLLPSGQVLVAGGCSEGWQIFGCTVRQASAELYDPATGTWTPTGSIATPRDEHTATLLPNGTVLVAGGDIGTASPNAEVYNPRSGAWSATGVMLTPAPLATATRLANGNVLVAGGATWNCGLYCVEGGLAGAELYTPGPGPLLSLAPGNLDFGNQAVGTISQPQTVTVTNTGTLPLDISSIAVTGTNATAFAEADTCTATPVAPAGTCTIMVRFTPAALGQDSASVVLVDNAPTSPQSVALSGVGIGPGGWAATGSMATSREDHTATLLPDGKVLVAGGSGCNGVSCVNALASAELYDPNTGTWAAAGSMITPREYHTATLLQSGLVLTAGGSNGDTTLSSAEVYIP